MGSLLSVIKKASFIGHKDCIYTAVRADEPHHFYTAGGDGLVVLWSALEPEIGKAVAQVGNSIYSLCLVPDANLLVIGQNFEGIHFIDCTNYTRKSAVKTGSNYIFDLQYAQGALYSTHGDGVVQKFDIETFSWLAAAKYSDKSARCVAINSLRAEIAVGYSDHCIRILDLETLECKKTLVSHQNSVFTVQYTPDFNLLLSGSRDAKIKVWDCNEAYSEKETIAAHLFAINHINFSPDGKWYASGSMDKSVKIWDATSHRLLKVVDKSRHAGHGTSVNKVIWLSEREIVSVSDDRTASLWHIDAI